MCFSAPASFIAGASLSTIGVATAREVKTKAELPLALVPLVFGLQQLVEGVVWLALKFDIYLLAMVMAYIYILISHVLWPILIPLALILIEPDVWRRRILVVIQFIGLGVGGSLFYFLGLAPVVARIVGHSVVYDVTYPYQYLLMLGYFLAVSASCLFSSHRLLNIFGIMTALLGILAYQFYAISFISVWCFFAAIVSVMIYFYFHTIRISKK